MLLHFDKRLPLQQLRMQAKNALDDGNGSLLQQRLGIEDLPRVKESCLALDLACTVRVGLNEQAWPSVEVQLDGTAVLDCVRCNQTMKFPIQSQLVWCLAADDAEQSKWTERIATVDVLCIKERVSVQELVEDEVLLCLPMIPRCEVTLSLDVIQGCANKSLSELMGLD
ncbi:MAG: hypothetical protein RLZZ502_220 [Pseudomonadota bacterium]|jgi:uncharacterized metal-binding protein YceD (DUF177 family)